MVCLIEKPSKVSKYQFGLLMTHIPPKQGYWLHAYILAAQNRQRKNFKNLIFESQCHPWSLLLVPIESAYNLLLVINSNLGRAVSHSFWYMATYWLKIANFPYSLSFDALAWGDPLQVYGKALRILILESSRQRMVKIWWS